MREIKFEAWDKALKCVLTWLECQEVIAIIGASQFFGCDEHYIKRQYTGLKDKNGKEIYEGDIVDLIPNGYVPYRATVEWLGNGYGCTDKDIGRLFNPKGQINDILVIGNIYENPELLKE